MPADTTGYPPEFAALLDNYNQEVTALMARLEAGKVTSAAWTKEMQGLLAKYSQAARMLGMGEVKLLPAEVDAVRAWLNEQFKYLDGFETVINSAGGEYDPAWLPRAQMYGASTVTEYWEGKTSGLPLPAQPGQGSQCLSNCKCSWSIQWLNKAKGDADCFWTLHPAEHCQTCETRAEMWNPVRIRGGNLEGDYETPATVITPPRTTPPAKPATPRQPKKPAAPQETKPGGTPVSGALNIGKGKYSKAYLETVQAIDKVHGDGALPEIPVTTSAARSRNGAFFYDHSGGPAKIVMSKFTEHPHLTLAHETGHFLDFWAIGRKGTFTSATPDPIISDWQDAVKESKAFKKWQEIKKTGKVAIGIKKDTLVPADIGYARYNMSYQELWARSYAQYITEKSRDPSMLAELSKKMEYEYPVQWETADFAPIKDAFDKLFGGLGWLK